MSAVATQRRLASVSTGRQHHEVHAWVSFALPDVSPRMRGQTYSFSMEIHAYEGSFDEMGVLDLCDKLRRTGALHVSLCLRVGWSEPVQSWAWVKPPRKERRP
jgi:hypothetical protein